MGLGPFVAVKPGDRIVDVFGVGIMLGLAKKGIVSNKTTSYFNVGVGWFWEPDVETLAEGFEDNKLAPAGAMDVEVQTETQQGFFLMFSFRPF